MGKKYSFEQLDNGEYVIADPKNGNQDPIRLDAKWIEGDEIEGEWERAIGALIKSDLLGNMDLKDGNGKIGRSQAVDTLAEVEDEDGPIVTSRDQADALLEYFAEEDIVDIQSGSVLVLQDPQDTDEVNGEMVLNWAAGIEACVEKIVETRDRIESAKEKLEDRLNEIDQDSGEIEEKVRETAQELKSLGNSQGVPQNPDELPAEERSRYQELKQKLIYHNKMKEVKTTDLTETVKQGTNELGDSLEKLDSARQALSSKQGEFRTLALQKQEFPDGAENIVQNMGDLATQLAGVGNIEEEVENAGVEEISDIVENVTETAEETTTKAEQTTPQDTREPSGDLEMSG